MELGTEYIVVAHEIMREREKHMDTWGNYIDDRQVLGELAVGAAAYTLDCPAMWPVLDIWRPCNFKRVDEVKRRGQLILAAAMIMAEIERLDRLAKKDTGD